MKSFSRKRFHQLPPRVIIHDILTKYYFVIKGNENRFCLFGFFKNDYSRNIWFVFSSLSIDINGFSTRHADSHRQVRRLMGRHFPFVNISKLSHISFQSFSQRSFLCQCWNVYKKIMAHSPDMYSLRSIEINDDIRRNDEETLLGGKTKFPNLKYLSFQDTSSKKIDWSLCDKSLFQNLHTLHLRGINHPKFLFTDHEKFKNLKVLNLEFDRILTNEVQQLYHEKEVHLNLPNLRVLCLTNVRQLLKNFKVIPNGKLRVFKCFECWDLEPYHDLVSKSPQLEVLEVGANRWIDGFSFLDPFIVTHAYPVLRRLKIECEFKLGETNYEFFESLMYQLEEIDIVLISFQEHDNTDVLSDLECTNLKKASIDFSQNFGTGPSQVYIKRLNWSCSSQLTHLSISGYTPFDNSNNPHEEPEWNDQLFIKNEFPSLEYLRMSNSSNVTGKGWSKLPSLKEIELTHLPNFTDTFFQEHDELRNLERLRIYDLDKYKFQGDAWNRCFTNSIKSLSFGRCTILISFFHHFPKLEKLSLETFCLGLEKFSMTGKGLFSVRKGREVSIGNRTIYFTTSESNKPKMILKKMKDKISDWDKFIFE